MHADEVVLGAGRLVAEHDLLGDAPAEANDERVDDVLALVDVPLLERQLLRHAQRHAGREDRHLVERVGELEHVRADGVPALVVGDDLLLLLRECERLAPQAHQHAVAGGVEVFLVDLLRPRGAPRTARLR